MQIRINVFFLFLITSSALLAQTEDFGIWTSIGMEKKMKKWNFSSEAELRTKDYSKQVNRWSLKLETTYDLFKPVKIGASYQFIYFHDTKYWDFQPRSRYVFFIQGKQKWGDFSFSLRERIQITTKDDRDRIKKSGKIDTYKITPEKTWRNRFVIAYDIPKFPVNPSVSVESFYQLNNPDGNTFDNLRYTLSFNYKPTKHNAFELYWLIDKEINIENPVKTYITGISYIYSF